MSGILKIDFKLREIAEIWSVLTNRAISENDIIDLAIDIDFAYHLTESAKKPIHKHSKVLPYVMIACRIYNARIKEIWDAKNARPAPIFSYQYVGRILVTLTELRKLQLSQEAFVDSAIDIDTNHRISFVEKVQILKCDLVITHDEKNRFENIYLMNHGEIGGAK